MQVGENRRSVFSCATYLQVFLPLINLGVLPKRNTYASLHSLLLSLTGRSSAMPVKRERERDRDAADGRRGSRRSGADAAADTWQGILGFSLATRLRSLLDHVRRIMTKVLQNSPSILPVGTKRKAKVVSDCVIVSD